MAITSAKSGASVERSTYHLFERNSEKRVITDNIHHRVSTSIILEREAIIWAIRSLVPSAAD